eukprot:g2946.t1
MLVELATTEISQLTDVVAEILHQEQTAYRTLKLDVAEVDRDTANAPASTTTVKNTVAKKTILSASCLFHLPPYIYCADAAAHVIWRWDEDWESSERSGGGRADSLSTAGGQPQLLPGMMNSYLAGSVGGGQSISPRKPPGVHPIGSKRSASSRRSRSQSPRKLVPKQVVRGALSQLNAGQSAAHDLKLKQAFGSSSAALDLSAGAAVSGSTSEEVEDPSRASSVNAVAVVGAEANKSAPHIFAGRYKKFGFRDGPLRESLLHGVSGITGCAQRNCLFVLDTENDALRKIDLGLMRIDTIPLHESTTSLKPRSFRAPKSICLLRGDVGFLQRIDLAQARRIAEFMREESSLEDKEDDKPPPRELASENLVQNNSITPSELTETLVREIARNPRPGDRMLPTFPQAFGGRKYSIMADDVVQFRPPTDRALSVLSKISGTRSRQMSFVEGASSDPFVTNLMAKLEKKVSEAGVGAAGGIEDAAPAGGSAAGGAKEPAGETTSALVPFSSAGKDANAGMQAAAAASSTGETSGHGVRLSQETAPTAAGGFYKTSTAAVGVLHEKAFGDGAPAHLANAFPITDAIDDSAAGREKSLAAAPTEEAPPEPPEDEEQLMTRLAISADHMIWYVNPDSGSCDVLAGDREGGYGYKDDAIGILSRFSSPKGMAQIRSVLL